MSVSTSSQARFNALEEIKSFRVSELQALLEHGNLSRQGNKRDLFQRCKLLITKDFTPQLASKIQQINHARIRSSRSHHVSSSSSTSRHHPIVLPKTPPMEVLPAAIHIHFVNLPFFDKMRTIDCANIPVDWHTFSPIRFLLNDQDIHLIRQNSAKVFLRIAPTVLHERHNDVLPPYLLVQCNNQTVINNNISKANGAQAHSVSFPTDITDKLILKVHATNTLTFLWLQSPLYGSLKNLPRSYTLSIQLVHCVSLDTLFDIIVKREPLTTKSDHDSDIEIEDLGLMTTRHRVSLLCPITQSLIGIPAKTASCLHLTCFDLKPFLQMNERRLQWACPLCKKSASFESLRIDERLRDIISHAPTNCSTVELDSSTDFQYILDSVKQEKLDVADTNDLARNHENESIHNSSTKSRRQSDESDCIVLSSGSESEDDDEEIDVNNEIHDLSLPVTPEFYSHDDLDERRTNELGDRTSHSSTSSVSSPSPVLSNLADGNYWEDLAQITYDFSPDDRENVSQRKRSRSSASSVRSSSSDADHRRTKRTKRVSPTKSRTADVEVITLYSSDSSDSEGRLL